MNVAETVLDDLRKRIANTRYVESIEGTNFNYGFNGNYLKQVIEYWKTKYDWRKQEKELNKYDHFKTQIAGIDIHFVHVKPTKPAKKVLPLLLIHGWPGSFIEFYKSIPLLTEPVDGIAFEVIVPSPATAVPEPSALTLLGIGAVSLVGYGWRRRRKSA